MSTRVNVTAFKSQACAYIESVSAGREDRVILTKHGRAVAELRPVAEPPPQPMTDLHGALQGSVRILEEDVTSPTGEIWETMEG